MSVVYPPLREQWFGNVRGDVLSGILVALALIPEAIAFAIIAGVDPRVGLYASFCIAVVTSIAGGRPGMISAATGAMALVMVGLVRDYGLQYLLAATILAGVLQILAGARAVPSPLVAIIVLTGASLWLGLDIRTVGDMGELPDALPVFLLPDIPLTLETLRIIFPVSATLAVVGLLESLMTAQIVEDMTDTPTDRRRECAGQGAGNIVAGLFGGMAGCAMIGQSVINVSSGGRGRLSCMVAGVVLLLLVVYASDWVAVIPMAALVAVMIMVSIGTFHWKSFREFKTHPKTANVIMLGTVVVTVATGDLAKGVLTGVLLTALSFTRRVSAMLHVEPDDAADGTRTYRVKGQVFFACAVQFANSFDYVHAPARVVIDLTCAHFWDTTAVAALDRAVLKLRRHGAEVKVIGLNRASQSLVDQLGTHGQQAHP